MQYLRTHRIDVQTDEQLERYDQLFVIPLTHTVFGLGERRSIEFVQFLTTVDFCNFRCVCFAVGVDLHDTLDDAHASQVVLFDPPSTWAFLDRCLLQ